MKHYNWSNQDFVVDGDTTIIPTTMFKNLVLSHVNTINKFIDDGIYDDKEFAKAWVRELDKIWFEVCKDHDELREARKAQKEIPF